MTTEVIITRGSRDIFTSKHYTNDRSHALDRACRKHWGQYAYFWRAAHIDQFNQDEWLGDICTGYGNRRRNILAQVKVQFKVS